MSRTRKYTAELLEAGLGQDTASKLVDAFLIALILANVAAVALESVPELGQQHARAFFTFELVSVVIFTVEYFLRLWSCVELPDPARKDRNLTRKRWALSPLGLVDLLAILPFYIWLFLPETGASLLMLRIFRALRLLRIFKLTRYSQAFSVLAVVVVKEARVLLVAASILFVLIMLASWGIFLFEREHQPDVFSSIPASMWWAVITLTTVGYGDVVPMTMGGRVFAGTVALMGFAIMALPAAILASGFYREVHHRSQTYRHAVEQALKDGKLSDHDLVELEELREELGIDAASASETRAEARKELETSQHCPHCGKNL